jgi:hypothetical protein
MKLLLTGGVAAAVLFGAGAAAAQSTQSSQVPPVEPVSSQPYAAATPTDPSAEPDVLLDVPNLSVEEITIEVENLEAHLSLEARLANLLHLKAGADVSVDNVKITIKGVEAQVLLKVRLDNVRQIIDRTLTTIDRNPEILERLLTTVDNTVDTVGGVANTTLQPGGVVDNAVGTVGQVAGQAVEPRR